jgi:hypothetical protein
MNNKVLKENGQVMQQVKLKKETKFLNKINYHKFKKIYDYL